jgi:hypothetical protein
VARRFALLALAAVFAIYLVTPADIGAHMRSSADRLLFQLWPAALLAISARWPPAP